MAATVHPLTSPIVSLIRASIEKRGVRATARDLHLSPEATLRLISGAPVQEGTVLVAERHVHNLVTGPDLAKAS